MKKYLTPCLAVVAVIAIIFCFVFNGQKGDIQKQLNDATAAAETKAADLQKQLDDATAAAETKVTEAVEAAKQEAEAKTADLQAQLDEAKAAAETQAAEAVEAAKQEAAAKVTELEGTIADLQKQAEEVKADAEAKLAAAEEAKTALETQVADLQKQLEEAAASATAAAEQATEQAETAVTEATEKVEETATEAAGQAETAVTEAAGQAETAVTEAAEQAETAVTETTEKVEEAAAEAAGQAETAVTEAAGQAEAAVTEAAEQAEAPAQEEAAAGEVKVLTHAEYLAAENDTEVVIESYVQDHQAWWDGKVTVYLQNDHEAYFAYELKCSEEEAAKLVPGQKVRVTGYKGEWAGEVEIMDGTVEFLDAEPWIAEAEDITAVLGTDELINHMNEFVAVKGATVVAYDDTGAAFAYKNPEEKTDDLYFKVDVGGQVYDFCVEFYLRGQDTDVYKAVEGLKVGDVVDLEGFLYWYNGANLQATSLTVK